jgi:hypothetical protein
LAIVLALAVPTLIAISSRRSVSSAVSSSGSAPALARAAPTQPLPERLWGVTLDDVSNAGSIVASLEALPVKPIARVVFDRGTTPADYAGAIGALHPHAYLMGELVDSSDVKAYTIAGYRQRAGSFVNAFGSQIDLWEVGNEVNGEWLGRTSQTVAKMSAAYQVVTAAGGRTALTLYYNPNCWSTASHEMFTWTKANVPAAMKAGLDYVFISYYPEDCNNYWPSQTTWQSVFDQLHQMFPNAKLGFGESGNSNDRDPVAQKIFLLHRYYQLQIQGDNYVGGYFWWYYVEDALPYTNNPLWQALSADIAARPSS